MHAHTQPYAYICTLLTYLPWNGVGKCSWVPGYFKVPVNKGELFKPVSEDSESPEKGILTF